MTRRFPQNLAALARRISRQPWNRAGTDKTFVHHAVHQYLLHRIATRGA